MLLSPYELCRNDSGLSELHLNGTLQEMKVHHLTTFAYVKAGCFAEVLLSCSKYMQPQTKCIFRIYNYDSGAVFTLKGIFKDSFISAVFSLSVLLNNRLPRLLGRCILFQFRQHHLKQHDLNDRDDRDHAGPTQLNHIAFLVQDFALKREGLHAKAGQL
jgi:hypothetical protein